MDFCAAVVAETVITKTLLKDWNDQALRPEVREFLLQHYRDELRHSAFYGQVLGQVWPQWDEDLRRALAPHWSALTLAFVEPDPQLSLAALAQAGFSDREAWRITAECQARALAAQGPAGLGRGHPARAAQGRRERVRAPEVTVA